MSENNLQAFVQSELARLSQQREQAMNRRLLDLPPEQRRERRLAPFADLHFDFYQERRIVSRVMKAKGMLPFLATTVGETTVRLLAKIPTDYDGGGGNIKKLFVVTSPKAPAVDSNGTVDKEWVAGKEYAWPVNPKSPLYREVLELLPKSPLNLAIVRTGKDKTDTRYSIRVLPN